MEKKILSNSLLNMFAKNLHLPLPGAARVLLRASASRTVPLPSHALCEISPTLLSVWYRAAADSDS
jgi:hypothetical protein